MDTISPQRRSHNMRQIRSKGMQPELTVRRAAHAMGYRYRLHRTSLPGKPDLVFVSRKKVIFVHGCFWHQHADGRCKITRKPKSNTKYWLPKLKRNVKRDIENRSKLEDLGWQVLVIWECQTADEKTLRRTIRKFLGSPGRAQGPFGEASARRADRQAFRLR